METTAQPPLLTPRQKAFSLVGMLLVAVGAVLAYVGIFLPFFSTPDPAVTIVDNAAISGAAGPGVLTIVGATCALALAIGRWRGVPMPAWIPSSIGVWGLCFVVFWVVDINNHDLYNVAYRGPYHASSSELSPGSGIWLIGAGALTVVLGGAFFAAIPLKLMKAVAPAPARVPATRPDTYGGPYGGAPQPAAFGGPYGGVQAAPSRQPQPQPHPAYGAPAAPP
ncbi:hypothetical protein Q5424_19880, partial [Conexibacter sp. JD483]|uniref:hypothetical protein n=2 Tax=Conexibacter TaxID=191494 RepID=UPI00287048A0